VSHAQFVRHVLNGDTEIEDRIRSNERILGDASFKKAVRGESEAEGVPEDDARGIPGTERLLSVSPV
jgi:hypothetical protein